MSGEARLLREIRALRGDIAHVADTLEAILDAGAETAPAAVPQVAVPEVDWPRQEIAEGRKPPLYPAPEPSPAAQDAYNVGQLSAMVKQLLEAAGGCLMKGDAGGPGRHSYIVSEVALERLDRVRTRIAEQMKEAGPA